MFGQRQRRKKQRREGHERREEISFHSILHDTNNHQTDKVPRPMLSGVLGKYFFAHVVFFLRGGFGICFFCDFFFREDIVSCFFFFRDFCFFLSQFCFFVFVLVIFLLVL